MCQPHWDELRAEIKRLGMDGLGAKSGQEAAANIVKELEGRLGPDDHDPLMSVNNMIFCHALECGGLYLMTGDFCPLCEAEKNGVAKGEWITGACAAEEQYCRERGILPKVPT